MNKDITIAHFSSVLPRACGIATYTHALRKTIKDRYPEIKHFVVAIDDNEKGYKYSSSVKFHFSDHDHDGYEKAAELINASDADVVNIQHEFGLYGTKVNDDTLGEDDGKNFLIFLRALKKPAVTTLHMVYKKPNSHHAKVVEEICERSVKIVVLTEIAKRFLIKKYKVSPEKVVVIPHGAPNVPRYSTSFFKEMLGFSRKDTIVSSFGLIRPKKGYEYLIDAIDEVRKVRPNVKLLIIGRYHPLRNPEYYAMLKEKVKTMKLGDHVKFVNKFVNYSDLLNYLMATNIFVAPFLVLDQVSSGTIIYAMACGRACISTPFEYAKEVLANHRGVLVPPANSHAIAEEINFLIEHPKARHHMQNLAYKYARKQVWSKVARTYKHLFIDAIKEGKRKK